MARYKYFDKSQGLFMTVNLEDQLIPGSFEHTLNYLIDRLDLTAFDAAFTASASRHYAVGAVQFFHSLRQCLP
ncbi:MAG: hypothetical protein LBH85_09175 [Treponema sp.]|jgi:hypothetical protein|nr:hypothetical protein [Treponema sp.]